MDLVGIALVIVALWVGFVVLVLAMCRASSRADADDERRFADGIELPERRRVHLPHLVGTHRHRS
jgi:hypothetical protein